MNNKYTWTAIGIFVFFTVVFLIWKGRGGEKAEEKPMAKPAAGAESDQVAQLKKELAELREKLKQPAEQPVAQPPRARGKKPIAPATAETPEAPDEAPDPEKTGEVLKRTKQQAEDLLAQQEQIEAEQERALNEELLALYAKLKTLRREERHDMKSVNVGGKQVAVGLYAYVPEEIARTEGQIAMLEKKIAAIKARKSN